jgi:hypothetical protein
LENVAVRKLFRRGVFAFSAFLILLLSLFTFFRVWSPRDLAAYHGMAAECHPVWRAFALRQFSRGGAITALFAKYPPTERDEFGRYGIYSFYRGDLKDGIPFTGLTVIARDGRLITATAGSCTWMFTFFETADPQFKQDYKAYMQEREQRQKPQ